MAQNHLSLSQGDEEEQQVEDEIEWKDLFVFATKKHIAFLILGIFFSVVSGFVLPIEALLLGLIFGEFTSYGSGITSSATFLSSVSKNCIWLVVLGITGWILHGTYFAIWMMFGEIQAKHGRERMFIKLIQSNMTFFDIQKHGIGALVTKVQAEIRELQLAVSQPLGTSIGLFVTSLVAAGIALYFSWNLTLVTLSTVPIAIAVTSFTSTRIDRLLHAQEEKSKGALKYCINTFTAIETVKCFNGQSLEIKKYFYAIKEAAKLYRQQAKWHSFNIGFAQLSFFTMFVQGFWYGSSLVHAGKNSPDQILTTFWASLMAMQSLNGIIPQLIVLRKGRFSGRALAKLIGEMTKESRRVERGSSNFHNEPLSIKLQDVSFAYPKRPEAPILHNISMTFPPGQTTFVIGKSGSGKSTLGQLLVRFYDIIDGEISLNGCNLNEVDIHWLRQNVTLVEQQCTLFNDTIWQNISLGKNELLDTHLLAVDAAVKFAQFDTTVNDLPYGYNTMVGRKGNCLSGGQRQRIALARAKMRNPSVLILDESMSALDYKTGANILEAIRIWRQKMTTIIITHDTSQILPNDYVYIMEAGHIIGRGYRKNLETKSGSFFSYFHSREREKFSVKKKYYDSLSINSFDGTSEDEDQCGKNEIPSPGELQLLEHIVHPERSRTSPKIPVSIDQALMRPSVLRALSNTALPAIVQTSFPATVSAQSQLPRVANTVRGSNIELVPCNADENITFQDGLTTIRPVSSIPENVEHRKEPPSNFEYSLWEIYSTVWMRLSRTFRILLITSFVCALIHAAATPIFAFVFAKLLSTFYLTQDHHKRSRMYALAIIGVAFIDGISSFLQHFLLECCGQTWSDNTRFDAMTKIVHQPRDFFDKTENSVSRLAECLDKFADEMRNLLGRFAGSMFVVAAMLLLAVIWSLVKSWRLTLIVLATSPLVYAVSAGYQAISLRFEGRSSDLDETIGSIMSECLTSIRTVKSLTLEHYFLTKLLHTSKIGLRVGFKKAIFAGVFYGLTKAVILFITALVFWYGAYCVARKDSSVDSVLQTFTILLISLAYVSQLTAFIPQLSSSKDSATRVLRLTRLPRSSHEHIGKTRINSIGAVELHNLTFSYPIRPTVRALQSISMKIPLGSCIAIVGPSGSGKSTIASLLLKLYSTNPHTLDPSITVAGQDIYRIHTPTLRDFITIVAQTPVIFPATVLENIIYGLHPSSPYTSLAHVHSAAAAAGIDDFIQSLPNSYNTQIGDGGITISGGQAQRIAIARAIVRKPRVLVLDEATSSLDAESARIIRKSIINLKSSQLKPMRETGDESVERVSMTVIIITHATDMMAIADHIIVLQRGEIVEEGKYRDLLRKRGAFAKLVKR